MTHWLVLNSVTTDVPYANFNSPFVKSITYILCTILIIAANCHGRRSSGVLFVFWLMLAICQAVTYRTHMLAATDSVSLKNLTDFVIQSLYFPLVISELVLSAFLDSLHPSISVLRKKNICPEVDAPFLSQLLFSWFDKMAFKGYKRPLVMNDLWELSPNNKCGHIVGKFSKNWEIKKTKLFRDSDSLEDEENSKQPSILGVLWTTFRWPFIFAGVLRVAADMLSFTGPMILQLLIAFVSSNEEPAWRGYFYAVVLFSSSLLQSLIYGQQYLIMFNIAMRVRAAVVSAIYRKALRINSSVKRASTVGEIVNLMSIDAQRLMDLLPEIHVTWSALIQIAVALYMLWGLLGPSVLAGLGTMLLMIPLNGLIAGRFKLLQIKQMKNKDNRVKTMNEILNGIKVLKLYAWEQSYGDQINNIRSKELKVMKTGAYLNAFASFVFSTVPLMVTLSTFATYVLIDKNNNLDATKAFVSLSLFNIIRMPLFFIPMLFISMLQAAVSFRRMNKFLNSEELNFSSVEHDETCEYPVYLNDVTFSWGPAAPPALFDINLTIPKGSLVAIVGPVGAGKSSLVSGMLGDMDKRSGRVNTQGTIAYVPQQAWMQNASLKDNILFGKKFNDHLYQTVIDACALRPDLEIFPGGDQTEIGEKGINLSGGQKQRVSLARAVYADTETYFLDDPLSAVDSHVGKHIFENVIGPSGLLSKKTRVFVTNGVTYLPKVDSIVVLSDGRISEMGSYEELLLKKGAFAEFLMTYLKDQETHDLSDADLTDLEEIAQDLLTHIGDPEIERQLSRRFSAKGVDGEHSSDGATSTAKNRKLSRDVNFDNRHLSTDKKRVSMDSARRGRNSVAVPPATDVTPKNKLIQAESLETGKVAWLVYMQYMRSLGLLSVCLTAIQYALSGAFGVGSNIWLSIWSNDQPSSDPVQNAALRDLRLGVYGGLGFGQAIMVFGASFVLAIGSINASSLLHSSMLGNILRCPMVFFDTTPLGRIVNRFSKDIDVVDTTIPTIMRPLIGTFLQVISTLIVISMSTPTFLVVVLPIGVVYFFVQRFYISTSRQLKRIESTTRSPIFSYFSETLSGASTIRAYRRVDDFIQESEARVDLNQSCYYPNVIANRWLSVRLELTANVMVFCATLFAVLSKDSIDPGTVGLSISYASSVTMALTFMVRMTCELETNIVAVERIKEYATEPTEAAWTISETKPPPSWPSSGTIKFQNYTMRYRPELDPVLRGITCGIREGEKIGIVGRTGAGKSSLTLALFRIIEPAGGTVFIDDVDITKIGLHDLRSKLTIIPQAYHKQLEQKSDIKAYHKQYSCMTNSFYCAVSGLPDHSKYLCILEQKSDNKDPVLFSGTLRMNLDPFASYTDEEVWKSVEQSHLKNFVASLQGGLHYPVAEGGENLSVGQRQLICLARALLRKTKVLILDEATAAVDLETDDLIQATIRKEFADCTVLTIAHRLNTIMDSTRVLVLSAGVIMEFNSPSVLLQDKKSQFYSMAKDARLVPS